MSEKIDFIQEASHLIEVIKTRKTRVTKCIQLEKWGRSIAQRVEEETIKRYRNYFVDFAVEKNLGVKFQKIPRLYERKAGGGE